MTVDLRLLLYRLHSLRLVNEYKYSIISIKMCKKI